MKRVVHMMLAMAAALGVGGCVTNGERFPNMQFTGEIFPTEPAVIRQPVLPEMLVPCRGHVFVPALGMTFVMKGKDAPDKGQYMREERLTPPYRVIPHGARVSMENSPERLNVELDDKGRIIGLYCG